MSQGPRRAIWPDDEASGSQDPGFSPTWAPPAPEQRPAWVPPTAGQQPTWLPPAPEQQPTAGQQPAWAPPSPDQQPAGLPIQPASRRRRLPTAAKALIIALAVVIAATIAVWAAGGFETRQTLVDRQAGEPLDLGPVEMTVDKAISYDLGDEAQIEVVGTCRLTSPHSEGSIHFSIGRNTYAGVRVNDQALLSTEAIMSLGVDDGMYFGRTREALSPDIPAVPCVIRYSLPLDALESDTATFLFWRLQFTEESNVKNEEDTSKTWNAASDGYRIKLPLRHVAR